MSSSKKQWSKTSKDKQVSSEPEPEPETEVGQEPPGSVSEALEGIALSKMRRPEDVKGSQPARRMAAVVLEVLAGLRSPTDAARTLEVSGTHYYNLEARAIQGLVAAFEPRSYGKPPDLEGKIRGLERERKKLEIELSRTRTLLRMAQRAVGLYGDEKEEKSSTRKKPRPGRQPSVRARRAVKGLLGDEPVPTVEKDEGIAERGSM